MNEVKQSDLKRSHFYLAYIPQLASPMKVRPCYVETLAVPVDSDPTSPTRKLVAGDITFLASSGSGEATLDFRCEDGVIVTFSHPTVGQDRPDSPPSGMRFFGPIDVPDELKPFLGWTSSVPAD